MRLNAERIQDQDAPHVGVSKIVVSLESRLMLIVVKSLDMNSLLTSPIRLFIQLIICPREELGEKNEIINLVSVTCIMSQNEMSETLR